MRKARFTEEQMVAIMSEADRDPVSAVAKRHGISEQTIYAWRKRFGGLQANDVKRPRQLEAENARLSRKAAKDAPVIARMKELSAQYPRYGYRRIRIFLGRDGHRMCARRRIGCSEPPGCKSRRRPRKAGRRRPIATASPVRAEPGVVLRLRLRLIAPTVSSSSG
jgi:putative transposase